MASAGASIAAIIIAAAVVGGEGALIGSVLAGIVEDHHARHIQEKLDHGGLLLWVHTRDEVHQAKVTDILTKHTAHDV